MNRDIFKQYIRRFDQAMKAQNRHILLLLDNFSGHKCPSYTPTNIKNLFLPPNTTARLQPLDAGIIHTFKAHYRNLQYERAYTIVNLNTEDPIDAFKVDQLQAMRWIHAAVKKLKPETVKNCWKAAGLLENNEPITAEKNQDREGVEE